MAPQTLILTYLNSDFGLNSVPDNGRSNTDPLGWYVYTSSGSASSVGVVDANSATGSVNAAGEISTTGEIVRLGHSSDELGETSWYQIDFSVDIARLGGMAGYNRFEIFVDTNGDGQYTNGDTVLGSYGLNSNFGVAAAPEGVYRTYSGTISLTPAQQAALAGKPISVEFTKYGSGAHFAVDNLQLSVTFCFARDTMIDTPDGEVAVQDLGIGDIVTTLDHGPQPLRWVGRRKLSAAQLMLAPNLRPVRIPAGALGDQLPREALTVSPQHRILLRSPIVRRMFETSEILIAAKHLIGYAGIDYVLPAEGVEYFHLLFEEHQVVMSNGAPSESLFTGPEAMRALSRDQRSEVLELFPELAGADKRPSARTFASGRQGRALVKRHRKNAKHLVA